MASTDPVALMGVGAERAVEVVLPEHSRSAPVVLPDAARAALFAVAGDRLRVMASPDPRAVVLESTSWVGSISVPGLHIRVTPVAPMASIFAMLGGLDDDVAWGGGSSGYDGGGELLEGSALMVLRAIDAATRRGLLHGYRSREENTATIRGRLLVDQLATRPWAMAQPPCRFDEFTPDVIENQRLRCAVRLVHSAPGLSPATRRRAAELLARFDGVSDTSPRDHDGDIPITRLNEHYESALNLAGMALQGFAIAHDAGDERAHAFMVDVDYVFMRFVASQLETRLWPQFHVTAAQPLSLDDGATLQATADVLVRGADGPALVLGTRYHLHDADAGSSGVAAGVSASLSTSARATSRRTPMAGVANDAASFFPVMVQAASLGLPSALVVYAHAARRPASRIRMPLGTTTVWSWHVDLDRPWAELSAELDELATHVERIIERR